MKDFFHSCCLSLLLLGLGLAGCQSGQVGEGIQSSHWVGSWATAPQLTKPRNNPPEPGLSHNTLRQVFRISLGGDQLRMRFSNEFSTTPLVLEKVWLAKSAGGGKVAPGAQVALTFNGKEGVTLAPGQGIYSDAVEFALEPLTVLAVTIAFGEVPSDITGHPGSRTTSYIIPGNAPELLDMSHATKTDHWYIISGLEVTASPDAAAVAIVGDSITDGRGSGTNKQNRWPDELAERLLANEATTQVAVLNQGIGGNCITKPCLGPAGIERFNRDVLDQKGVKWLIILEGINDIGGQGTPETAEAIIAAYGDMITRAHEAGIKVYGATLLPMRGSQYESEGSLQARQTVNEWIRNSGQFDAVIDFASALEDPDRPGHLLLQADSGDGLHPSERGYEMMAEAVDLSLFH